MRTYMMIQKDEKGNVTEIAGPCIEADMIIDDGIEMIDEAIFRTLQPQAYRDYIIENLIEAVVTQVDNLYNCQKPYTLDVKINSLFTNDYVITVETGNVHIYFYANCPPCEAAALILHLKTWILDDISLIITEIPLSQAVFCKN